MMEGSEYSDDFQSPVQPNLYIELRIRPMQEFYANRIGPAVRKKYLWVILGLICGAVSSILAYLKMITALAIPSAFASAFIAWAEFTDIDRKIVRYNDALTGFNKLLLWWDALGEVEQASTANVAILVQTCEKITSDEFGAWQSTANLEKVDKGDLDDSDDDTKPKRA